MAAKDSAHTEGQRIPSAQESCAGPGGKAVLARRLLPQSQDPGGCVLWLQRQGPTPRVQVSVLSRKENSTESLTIKGSVRLCVCL